MDLEAVGDLALHIILTKLGAKDTAVAACVSKKLRFFASEETLWFKFCSQDLNLNQPVDPLGNPTPSFKVLFLPLTTTSHSFLAGFYSLCLCQFHF